MNKKAIFFSHIFKCAGTTFNSILESNFKEKVLYAEKPNGTRGKLSKQSLAAFLKESNTQYRAISSHNAEPSCAKLAKVSLTLLRDPNSRNWSAFHFEKKQGSISNQLSYDDYLTINHNFQTRILTEGLGGRDLKPREISKFFTIGIIERFDASMIAFEWILEQKGINVDFALPKKLNTQNYASAANDHDWMIRSERLHAEINHKSKFILDQHLYHQGNLFLDEILAKIPDLRKRSEHYFKRIDEKRMTSALQANPGTQSQSRQSSFTFIAPTTRDGMLPGHENTEPKCHFGTIRR